MTDAFSEVSYTFLLVPFESLRARETGRTRGVNHRETQVVRPVLW
jgi:hypothetical protein